MFNIILYQPEIPPNTGNIIRLCANTGCRLHLIHPLGFQLDEKRVNRAGMDYRDLASVEQYQSLDIFYAKARPKRLFAISTRGTSRYSEINFRPSDYFLFGPETRGLPDEILSTFAQGMILKIPMLDQSRSLNLSNAVSVIVYEAWRQMDFQ